MEGSEIRKINNLFVIIYIQEEAFVLGGLYELDSGTSLYKNRKKSDKY